MFNLMSFFRSKPGLPDDETIVEHAEPVARFTVRNQNLAVYRTKSRLLITAAETPWLPVGWMPLGTKLEALKAATRLNFDGFNLGWENYQAMQENAWKEACAEP